MNLTNLLIWLEWTGLACGVLVTMTLLAIGHWFPWIRPLSRIGRYIYGVSSIIAGFTAWRVVFGALAALCGLAEWSFVLNELVIPGGLLVISSAGGAVVIWAYRRDELARRVRQARRGEELVNAIEKQKVA